MRLHIKVCHFVIHKADQSHIVFNLAQARVLRLVVKTSIWRNKVKICSGLRRWPLAKVSTPLGWRLSKIFSYWTSPFGWICCPTSWGQFIWSGPKNQVSSVAGRYLFSLDAVFLRTPPENRPHTPATEDYQGRIVLALASCALNTSSSLPPTQITYNSGDEFNFQSEQIYAKTAFSIIRWDFLLFKALTSKP